MINLLLICFYSFTVQRDPKKRKVKLVEKHLIQVDFGLEDSDDDSDFEVGDHKEGILRMFSMCYSCYGNEHFFSAQQKKLHTINYYTSCQHIFRSTITGTYTYRNLSIHITFYFFVLNCKL